MGIFSSFAKSTYRGICRAMIRSYNSVKRQNPDIKGRELYARALSLRPTWKRESEDSFVFSKGGEKFEIKDSDTFRDAVRNVVVFETMPADSGRDTDFVTSTLLDITSVIQDEFKEFEE